MIAHQLTLIRREVWEHRSIWMTPLVIALIVSLLSLTGQVVVSGFDHAVDIAIVGASNIGENERRVAITAFLVGISLLFILAMQVLTVFYSLDALYAERKDKSILFWRSLPVTDAETVLSKLITAGLLIPIITFVAVVVTHVFNLVISSIWLSAQGGDAGHLIWSSVPLIDNWLATLIVFVALPLWMSPFLGWFLFVSSFTKRSPLLVAFLPILVVPMLERIILGTSIFSEAIFVRTGKMPLFHGMESADFFDEDKLTVSGEAISLLARIDLAGFLTSPSLWLGLVVCGLFTTAAIYMRRYREEG